MSGAVWRDDRNGPRERARAVTLSQGLSGGVTPDFAGPGRYLPPRNPPAARHLDAKDYPFSADIDRELRGEEPPVRRTPPSLCRADAPPFEKNPPAHGLGMIRRDGAGGAEQRPARVVADPQDDLMAMLGPEHWMTGERPDDSPGPSWTLKPMTLRLWRWWMR